MMVPSFAPGEQIPQGLGLAAYPGDSNYDPNRPSWVPFWFDTPTESALRYGVYAAGGAILQNPALVVLPPPPPTPKPPENLTTPPADELDAQATIDAILTQQMREWQAANAAAIAQTKANVDEATASKGLPTWVWLAVVGGGVLLLMRR